MYVALARYSCVVTSPFLCAVGTALATFTLGLSLIVQNILHHAAVTADKRKDLECQHYFVQFLQGL